MSTDKPEQGLGSRTGSSGVPSENHVRKWSDRIGSGLYILLGSMALLVGPVGVALSVSSQTPLAEAEGFPWEVIVPGAAVAAVMIWSGIIIARLIAEDSDKNVAVASAGIIALIVLAGPTLSILVAGTVVTNIAADGATVVHDPPQSMTTVGDIYEQIIWDAVDTIPLVEVPRILGWEAPVKDPAAPLGIASLTICLAIVLFTISSISLIVKHARLVLRERDRTRVNAPNGGTG